MPKWRFSHVRPCFGKSSKGGPILTNKECVLASLRHEQPARTPWVVGFTQPAKEKMVRYFGDRECARNWIVTW